MTDHEIQEQLDAAIREGARAARWHALTPFEQHVGLALSDQVVRGDSVADCPISAEILRLAPRVATAIEETLMADRRARAADGISLFTTTWHRIAVAALRGSDA